MLFLQTFPTRTVKNMTYMQAFEKIKSKLEGKAKISDKYSDFAIQVELTNKDCSGIFYIKYADEFLDIQPYDYVDNTASISLSYTSFSKLVDGRITTDEAVSKGLMNVSGNSDVVSALYSIVPEDKTDKTKKSVSTKKASAKSNTKPVSGKSEVKKATTEAESQKTVKSDKAKVTAKTLPKTAEKNTTKTKA